MIIKLLNIQINKLLFNFYNKFKGISQYRNIAIFEFFLNYFFLIFIYYVYYVKISN